MVERKRAMTVYGVREHIKTQSDPRERDESEQEIKEVLRMGRHDKDRVRPLRVTLRSQTAIKEILEKCLDYGKMKSSSKFTSRRV